VRPKLLPSALLALLLAALLVPALAPAPVAAATPGLTLVGATTYDVLPKDGKVAVSVRLTATNRMADTKTRRFFFRTGYLTVLPHVSGLKIAGGGGKPKVSVSSKTATYTILKIDLGANLASGKSTTLSLAFDLKDPGGAPDRPMRISPSLVSFAAWAFATPETPGASVRLRFPDGYHVTTGRAKLKGPESDDAGHSSWSSGAIAKPIDFVADVFADRPAEYVSTQRVIKLSGNQATITLRAWPDDPAWRDRIGALIERALPVLQDEIGLPWPVGGTLAVQEALVRGTGGYAAVYAPEEQRIEIAYAAPDGVVLHELAHAWINGGLVADRWAAEGFAAYYAERAADRLGIKPAPPPAPPTGPQDPVAAAFPLNQWGSSDTEDAASEAYGYATSLELARQIAERAGPDGMSRVWRMAAAHLGAYRADPGTDESVASSPDWRGLLDVLEQQTGRSYVDLWRSVVARPADLELLSARAAALGFYTRSVQLAGSWSLPRPIRAAMRAWQFDNARQLLQAADDVVAQRDALRKSAGAAGVDLPATLRIAFEGDSGLTVARAEASAEQAVVDAIAGAQAARPKRLAPADAAVVELGLLATDPDGLLEMARSALETGDLAASYAAAQQAQITWTDAPRLGRSRIVSTVLLLVALGLLIGLIRQRRRTAPEGGLPPEGGVPAEG